MSDAPLEERLAAVERALAEGDGSAPDIAAPDRDVVDRVDTLEEDVAELEAAVQAVRGYAGSVKHVNDEIEQRADAAMAKVEALERALAGGEDVAGTGITGTATDDRPTCADGHRGGRSTSGAPFEHTEPCSPTSVAGTVTDPERPGSVDRRNQRNGDRCVEPGSGSASGTGDAHSSAGDGDGERREPCEPGRGRVGHRRLEGSDEADGLLARLREVL